jgi:hypothetical protein
MKSAIALAVLLCLTVNIANQERPKAKEKRVETIIMGPLMVGRLYAKNTPDSVLDAFCRNAGLSQKTIVDVLNKCNMYVIDKKANSGKNWVFLEAEDGFPKLCVEGLWDYTLQDDKDKKLSIRIRSVEIHGLSTDYSVSPTQRGFVIAVKLEFDSVVGEQRSSLTYVIAAVKGVTYDINGEGFRLKW